MKLTKYLFQVVLHVQMTFSVTFDDVFAKISKNIFKNSGK